MPRASSRSSWWAPRMPSRISSSCRARGRSRAAGWTASWGLDGVRAEIAILSDPGRPRTTRADEIPHAFGSRRQPARAGEHTGHPPCRIRRRRHRRRGRQPASPRRGARRRAGALRGQLPALLRPRPRGDHRRAGRADRLTGPVQPPTPDQPERPDSRSRKRIPLRERGDARVDDGLADGRPRRIALRDSRHIRPKGHTVEGDPGLASRVFPMGRVLII